MPSAPSLAPARRPVRTRRTLRAVRARRVLAPATIAAGAALGVLLTTGFTAATPALAAAAASAPIALSSIATPAAAIVGDETIREIRTDTQATLLAARIALTEADTIATAIETSGLDIGVDDTSIDTAALSDATDRLTQRDVLPILLLPALADDTAKLTDAVTSRVDVLRERLDAAKAKKAAEEAAAAAAAEAKRQAEAAAAALAAANTPEGAQAVARQQAAANYGWGDGQFSCLESLWAKESGWNYQAYNASSGATGIPQSLPGDKMASAGADWQTNAATQIAWGLDYIARAYGSPCAAWGHSQATNWY